jgi:hypothetical protein
MASWASAEVDRSISQHAGPDPSQPLKAPSAESPEGPAASLPEGLEKGPGSRWNATWLGLGLAALCLVVYFICRPDRPNPYLHFVLQAQAWLDGQTSIPMPGYQDVMPILNAAGASTGRGIIPFPPLPAWILLPFVAIWHEATNEQLLAVVFAAIDVGIAYWMLGFLPIDTRIRWLTSLFLGLGSVLWYAAVIGTTWFFAHVVAVGCLLLAVGLSLSVDRDAAQPVPLGDGLRTVPRVRGSGGWWALALLAGLGAGGEGLLMLAGSHASAAQVAGLGLALGVAFTLLALAVAGRRGVVAPILAVVAVVAGLPAILIAGAASPGLVEVIDILLALVIAGLWLVSRRESSRMDRVLGQAWAALSTPEAVQVAAGIFFGLAVTARLTILFGFPFFLLVGGGGTWLRRGLLAGAGAGIPLITLLVVTYATSGQLFNPAYDYLYHLELAYPFGYHADWSVSDIRYIPQNLSIMLLNQPWWYAAANSSGQALCTAAGAGRSLFDPTCPLAMPNPIGMSLILSSPGYLLALAAFAPLRRLRLDRATVGAAVAVLAIAVVNLAHFSQGWVQFGYRFSNDFVPFALVAIALGASRVGRLWPVVLLVGASVAINFWGTMWGVTLGW